jgi:LysM repeat protein
MRKAVLVGLLMCSACGPIATSAVPAAHDLEPYKTMTPSATAEASAGLIDSSTIAPPTPTPFAYKIRAGDTMGGIADKFNVGLDALLAANPGVNPNSMSVGKTLNIPSNPKNVTGEGTPTPAPFAVQQITCRATTDGGQWCFVLAHNDSPVLMEDVTAQVTLVDADGKSLGSQMALLPLDILPPGSSLPLSVFFAPGLPGVGLPDARPQVQVLSAIRLLPNDARYLDAKVVNPQVQVDWSGLSGQASGQIALPVDSKAASQVWVAAVVYDKDGNVTGVRRWEASGGMQPGSSLPFSFGVASLAGEIGRVDFAVEARP